MYLQVNQLGKDGGDVIEENLKNSFGPHRYWCIRVNGGQIGYNWAAIVYDLRFQGVTTKKVQID